MNSIDEHVLAVIVTYQPDVVALRVLVQALVGQVDQVLIVDNTPAHDDRAHLAVADLPQVLSTLRLLRLGENLGIAAALNIGIGVAVGEGYTYVLLSDQDSLPAPDMVRQLLGVTRRLLATEMRIGAVSAAYVDRNTGHSFGFQVQESDRFFYSTRPGDAADPWVEVVTSITSGSLFPSRVFADVGLMREDWFIDYIDTEWCHRARHLGYRVFGTSLAKLGHSLGDRTFRVWYGRWRPYNGYSPQRLYYRFRNFVLLMRCAYVPWRWKVRAGWYWLGNLYAYVLFSSQRLQNLRFIIRGLADGVRRSTGRIDRVRHATTTWDKT